MASRETQEIVDKLTAMEDTFFHKLVEDKDFCEELIQTVTGKKSLRLVEATAQKSLRNIKGRSVVLDAYCIDTDNDNYDVEVQKEDNDDHQRRVRYNGSNMDTYMTEKGIKFGKIPDAYVIYISKKDFFGKGKTIYHIDRVLRETGDVVDNGFYEIYVNTEIDDNSDIAELMKIYSSPDVPENSKFPKTCAGIKNLKTGKGRDSMCALVEEYAEKKARTLMEEYAEKKAKEREKETAIHLIKIGKLTVEEIAASIPSLSVEEIIELQESVLQIS